MPWLRPWRMCSQARGRARGRPRALHWGGGAATLDGRRAAARASVARRSSWLGDWAAVWCFGHVEGVWRAPGDHRVPAPVPTCEVGGGRGRSQRWGGNQLWPLPAGPLIFKLGAGKLIPGLEEVLVGMPPGAKRRCLIPPEVSSCCSAPGPALLLLAAAALCARKRLAAHLASTGSRPQQGARALRRAPRAKRWPQQPAWGGALPLPA
jgi:hypothetical protein